MFGDGSARFRPMLGRVLDLELPLWAGCVTQLLGGARWPGVSNRGVARAASHGVELSDRVAAPLSRRAPLVLSQGLPRRSLRKARRRESWGFGYLPSSAPFLAVLPGRSGGPTWT